MVEKRVIVGTMVGTLAVAAAFAMPALGAPDSAHRAVARATAGQVFFTPASADPKLAALIARNGLGAAPFRFTPAESRGDRRVAAITLPIAPKAGVVTLRGPVNSVGAAPIGVAPIAYDLVSTTAAKRLKITGDSPKMDIGTSPGTRRPMELGFTLSSRRSTSKLRANPDRALTADTRLAGTPNDMIDVGGSYSLRRNLDVTAGIRYKSQDRDRLAPLPDAQRDSQAVYVGTAFRF